MRLHAYKRMVPVRVRTFADVLVEEIGAHLGAMLAGLGKRAGGRRAVSG